MNDVLVKPFKSSVVRDLIEKWNTALILPSALEITTLLEVQDNDQKVWNEEDFIDTIAHDYHFGKQLISDFINQTENLIGMIPALIDERNFEELRRTGHTLKGSGSTVSAFTISDYGVRLNKAAKLENIDALN